MSLYDDFLKGDRRALAKIISYIEDRKNDYRQALALMSEKRGKAYRIGITGPPGAGKSTLVDALVNQLVENNQKIGIIAVDPSSPFTGGALLGDRIRMQHLSNRQNIFIRSMASRGKSGGLAAATRDVSIALDAFGMDYIFIETVGIGQVELDIVNACDTVVVVLVPESGDMIQTMKAGLMEIADIFCVNKIDREGGERLITLLNMNIHESLKRDDQEFPAIGTNGISGAGVDILMKSILDYQEYVKSKGLYESRRREQYRTEVLDIIRDRFTRHLEKKMSGGESEMSNLLNNSGSDPYGVAEKIFDHYFGGSPLNGWN